MGSAMASSDLTLGDLERSYSKSPRFQVKLVKVTHTSKTLSRKGAKLSHMLPLTINRKLYMASPMTP